MYKFCFQINNYIYIFVILSTDHLSNDLTLDYEHINPCI